MVKLIKSVYIIGIGGISLSALAIILKSKGFIVYGSDLVKSHITDELEKKGFDIIIGHAPDFVKVADIIVYSSAVNEEDIDLKLAKKLNKKIMTRAELLGLISRQYRTISISGSHGKTTTTGMIASVFLNSNKSPNIHIGGILNNIQSNVYVGNDNIFITEACEYKDSFLKLSNNISVVLNIKPDHLDYFKNLDNIFESFQKFVDNTKEGGFVVYNNDDALCRKLKYNDKIISYGINEKSDVMAKNIRLKENGKYNFDIFNNGVLCMNIDLPCFGYHNIYNALATFCVCYYEGLSFIDIKNGIESFKGIKRRFEYINNFNSNLIIHDYAHHPDEILATIKTGLELKKDKIIIIFQPHTFSRTKDLYNEFLNALSNGNEVWLLPIYPAREKPIKGISSFKLYKDLKDMGCKCRYFSNFEKCYNQIKKYKDKNTLFEILGAGDIEKLSDMLK